MTSALHIYSTAWFRELEDRIDAILVLYETDPEKAHVQEDELLREYLMRRASADDQGALLLLALVNNDERRWYA